MADNSTLPNGDVVAADEIAGVKYQLVKFLLGALDVDSGPVHSGNPLPMREMPQSATIINVTTANPGTGWQAFGALACTALDVANRSGVDVEYRRNAGGSAYKLSDGDARLIQCITNANQIEMRRVDQSNTPVSLSAEGFVI